MDTSELVRGIDDWAADVHRQADDALVDRLYERIPIATGRLRGSAQRTSAPRSSSIEFTAEHASFSDEGTNPHYIDGNPLLAFYWGKVGAFVIVHSVFHPGTTDQRWFSDVMNDAEYEAELERAAESTPLL